MIAQTINWLEFLRQYDEGLHTRQQVARLIEDLLLAASQDTNQAYVENLEVVMQAANETPAPDAASSRQAFQEWLLGTMLRVSKVPFTRTSIQQCMPELAHAMGDIDDVVFIVGDRAAMSDGGWGWGGAYISTQKEADDFDDLISLLEIYVWLKDGVSKEAI